MLRLRFNQFDTRQYHGDIILLGKRVCDEIFKKCFLSKNVMSVYINMYIDTLSSFTRSTTITSLQEVNIFPL